MSGERPVAKLVRLPKERKHDRTGLLGRLSGFLAGSDEGIISAGADHALPAPVALGMLMIAGELTDTSGG